MSTICIFVFPFSVLGIVLDRYLALKYADWHASKVTPRNTAIMVVFAWSVTTLTCSMFAAFGDTKLLVYFRDIFGRNCHVYNSPTSCQELSKNPMISDAGSATT